MTTVQRIKNLAREQGISMTYLCKKIGLTSRTYFNDIEKHNREIPLDKLSIIASALNTTVGYLRGETDEIRTPLPTNIFPITRKRFRMLGAIACGEPRYADEDHETYVEASADIQADFCLTAKGDSMIGARIMDGDIVFIREQPMVEDGEIAAVIIDDEATLKRVKYNKEKQQLTLFPANDKYDPLVFIGEELNQIRILGKAVCFMSNL